MSEPIIPILYRSEWERQKERWESYRNGIIHITDLVRCKERLRLLQEYPMLYKLEPYYLLANLLHEGTELRLSRLMKCKTELDYDGPFTKTIGEFTLTGKPDIIMDDGTVVDLKFPRDVKNNQPNEHHVMQVRLYLWLLDKEKGKLVYLTPNKSVEFEIEGKPDDDEVLLIIDQWTSPRWDWECSYCEFSCVCSKSKR